MLGILFVLFRNWYLSSLSCLFQKSLFLAKRRLADFVLCEFYSLLPVAHACVGFGGTALLRTGLMVY